MFISGLTFLTGSGGNDWNFVLQSFLLVLFCVGFLAITYYITKYIARARISGNYSGNVYIAEAVSVGVGATVQLIKAGGKYILIGVNKERIVLLSEIDPKDIKPPEVGPIIGKGLFDKYLQKLINKNKDSGGDSINED